MHGHLNVKLISSNSGRRTDISTSRELLTQHHSVTPLFKLQGSPVDMSLYKLYYVFFFLSHMKRASEKTSKSLVNNKFIICQETTALDLSVRQLRASLDKKCT